MRRRLLIIAIFLLAGAVVNVAVAWGSSWLVEARTAEPSRVFDTYFRGEPSFDGRRWRIKTADRVALWSVSMREGAQIRSEVLVDDWIPEWSRRYFEGPDPEDYERFGSVREAEARGWPLLALWGAVEQDRFDLPFPHRQLPRFFHAVPFDTPKATRIIPTGKIRFLPTAIIWSGFTVNTLLYAAILWLLIPGPFALRRFIRTRRGLCPKCAYPMGNAAVCTECGKPLPHRAVA